MDIETLKQLTSKVSRINDLNQFSARLEVAKAFSFPKTILRFECMMRLYEIEGMTLNAMATLSEHWTNNMLDLIEQENGTETRIAIEKSLHLRR